MKTQICSYSIVVMLCLGLCMTGCKRNGSKKTQENEVTFDSITVDKTVHLLDSLQNPNCNLKIKFTYPTQIPDEKLLKSVQQQFIVKCFGEAYGSLSPQEAIVKYTNDYLSEYKALEDDFKKELEAAEGPINSWFSYYEYSENEIVYNRNNLLSYVVRVENYTGGAHGSHTLTNQTIDLKTGKPLAEEDIFIEDYQDELAKILVEEIASQNSKTDAKELENIGFFSIDEIYSNKNFYVDEKGLVYTFNEYEIAAYAVGAITVQLPFERISHLLRKESPIASLAF